MRSSVCCCMGGWPCWVRDMLCGGGACSCWLPCCSPHGHTYWRGIARLLQGQKHQGACLRGLAVLGGEHALLRRRLQLLAADVRLVRIAGQACWWGWDAAR